MNIQCTQSPYVTGTFQQNTDNLHPISMGQGKEDVTTFLTHWGYIFLALTHHK